jgi:DNA-binding helix-hairpin-helix protein with protein kinase domain
VFVSNDISFFSSLKIWVIGSGFGLFEIQVFSRRKRRRRQKEDYLATQASISQDGALGLRFL